MGNRFSIKQILRKLTLSREHIAHTLTEDVVRKRKVKNQQNYQFTTRSKQCPKELVIDSSRNQF